VDSLPGAEGVELLDVEFGPLPGFVGPVAGSGEGTDGNGKLGFACPEEWNRDGDLLRLCSRIFKFGPLTLKLHLSYLGFDGCEFFPQGFFGDDLFRHPGGLDGVTAALLDLVGGHAQVPGGALDATGDIGAAVHPPRVASGLQVLVLDPLPSLAEHPHQLGVVPVAFLLGVESVHPEPP
jgi:hypothetical protein